MALEPAAQEAVRDVLNDYGIRMDVALRERNAYLATSEQELLLAGQTGDASAMSTIVERQLQVRLAVRNANDEFAPAIAAKLPAEAGAKFLQVVHERSFPQVFRPTQFGRLLAAAKELEGLDAAVLKSVSDLEQAYLTELAASNEQLMQVTRSVEPEQWKAKAKRQVLVGEGDSAESASGPLQEENAKRMLMGQRYVQQLQTLLTPEQMAALPQQGERAPRDSGDARGKLERGAGQDKMTKKFDLDGDGVLNEQEREALRQFIASQRGGG